MHVVLWPAGKVDIILIVILLFDIKGGFMSTCCEDVGRVLDLTSTKLCGIIRTVRAPGKMYFLGVLVICLNSVLLKTTKNSSQFKT